MRLQEPQRDGKMKVLARLATAICAGLLLVSCNSGKSQERDAGMISTSLSISSYATAREHASASKDGTYFFPVLEIYNGSGVLIYRGHESAENTRTLKEFPGSIQNLRPQEQASHLLKLLEEFPVFKERERGIQAKKWVIISTGLDGCEGCAVQEHTLREEKQRLLQQSVSILEIHVTPP